ncbi:hypothetical protein L1267_17840 [Pseudoalteromonas sp. OFAV1]|uniref:hypothetical protein n=1 Tax=Pseudoalteromonas sp. OFAV1 TaxID=2908892 RepID=UPI001F476DE6|nr:hypothetical protein [Pseudoalteromonas sp. OFAV1]MCF2902234.1 hypothetical protein [Pseudoalteromonas sp. OFAV1]
MSIVYEFKLKTFIDRSISPNLYRFLNLAINTESEPPSGLFNEFINPDIAERAFNFIRYSRPPEMVWSAPYTEWDIEDISNSWFKHSQVNGHDAELIRDFISTKVTKTLFFFNKKTETDLSELSEVISFYPKTLFKDGFLFISNEYSSNDSFNFEELVLFLNEHRDNEQRMLTAFKNDDQVMPKVCLHINQGEIELFEGAYETVSVNNNTIQYDRNGFFCGEFAENPENKFTTEQYGFLPPRELKYKIDWLDEDDVAMVKSAIERY